MNARRQQWGRTEGTSPWMGAAVGRVLATREPAAAQRFNSTQPIFSSTRRSPR
jgi:hypothetical protein